MMERYSRQIPLWGEEGQKKLKESIVAVVGCGGLGGFIIEALIRVGIGKIVAIDPEVFEESNLNRQILSRVNNIGGSKAEEARRRALEINPGVEVIPKRERLTWENAKSLLKGANVVVDALDNVESRKILVRSAVELGIPVVHGAVDGWWGRVCVIREEKDIEILYPKGVKSPSLIPAIAPLVELTAGFQTCEVLKILLDIGTTLEKRLLWIDALEGNVMTIKI
ncbi:MAG: HesA/MoeB/ThiF family protein [Synergistetes bacterium]|nr:HesA/MoeB/ThiF family protein [Synergistota bacterium]